jgi:uncharacterized protein YchJ
MNSEKVFDYSDEFLSEITDHLITLKIQNLSKTKSNEFNNQLKIDFVTILINLQIVQEPEPDQKKQVIKPGVINSKSFRKKMSRNEPCSCGSGKKYKKCCGAL